MCVDYDRRFGQFMASMVYLSKGCPLVGCLWLMVSFSLLNADEPERSWLRFYCQGHGTAATLVEVVKQRIPSQYSQRMASWMAATLDTMLICAVLCRCVRNPGSKPKKVAASTPR